MWARAEAPRFHEKGTHFSKNNTNNTTKAQNTSFPAELRIRFLLYYSSYYGLAPEGLVNNNLKLSSALLSGELLHLSKLAPPVEFI